MTDKDKGQWLFIQPTKKGSALPKTKKIHLRRRSRMNHSLCGKVFPAAHTVPRPQDESIVCQKCRKIQTLRKEQTYLKFALRALIEFKRYIEEGVFDPSKQNLGAAVYPPNIRQRAALAVEETARIIFDLDPHQVLLPRDYYSRVRNPQPRIPFEGEEPEEE